MAMQKVCLVFGGPIIRIVPVRVDGGRVNSGIIGKELKPGEQLMGVIGHPPGKLTPKKANQILREQIDLTTVMQELKIPLPEMIDYLGLPFKFMKGVATVGQFAGLVKAGYEIRGHNADELKTIIANESNADKGTGYVALLDGRALAEELNRQNPGRKFRVPFEPELLKLNELVGNRLSGRDFFIWTETKYNDIMFVLRLRGYGYRYADLPEGRRSDGAVRLVEDR